MNQKFFHTTYKSCSLYKAAKSGSYLSHFGTGNDFASKGKNSERDAINGLEVNLRIGTIIAAAFKHCAGPIRANTISIESIGSTFVPAEYPILLKMRKEPSSAFTAMNLCVVEAEAVASLTSAPSCIADGPTVLIFVCATVSAICNKRTRTGSSGDSVRKSGYRHSHHHCEGQAGT